MSSLATMAAGACSLPSPPGDPTGRSQSPEILTPGEAVALLRQSSVGRVGFVVDGWPVVLPVNFCFDGSDVIIRTDTRSTLAAATRGSARVALEVDAPVMLYKSGWSVLAHGVADEVTGAEELARVRALPLEPWAGGAREHWLRIRIAQVTGRRLPERGRYPHPPA